MILYAVLIKIVLFPFGMKQQKNMIKQASLRPKEMAIRKRYAGRNDKKTQMKMQEDLQSFIRVRITTLCRDADLCLFSFPLSGYFTVLFTDR